MKLSLLSLLALGVPVVRSIALPDPAADAGASLPLEASEDQSEITLVKREYLQDGKQICELCDIGWKNCKMIDCKLIHKLIEAIVLPELQLAQQKAEQKEKERLKAMDEKYGVGWYAGWNEMVVLGKKQELYEIA